MLIYYDSCKCYMLQVHDYDDNEYLGDITIGTPQQRFMYGTGSAKGFLGNDTVRFGAEDEDQLIVPGTVFGQAETIADFFAD
ncbi:hypothetical protein TELCIR_20748, partial [Teladorsagia circumcincta]